MKPLVIYHANCADGGGHKHAAGFRVLREHELARV